MRSKAAPRSMVFAIVITLFIFMISFTVTQIYYRQGAAQLDRAMKKRDELTLEVQDLRDQLEYAQTDEFVMRMARDKLGMILPGEVRYVSANG